MTQGECNSEGDPVERDVSIVIATYNRAEILRETLENMSRVDRAGLNVEWVLIDNNSLDHTSAVIDSFADTLPLCRLFEPQPGKNHALNKALNERPLGRIIVFTDDDITPARNWLREIVAATSRWPDCDVFGGKIRIAWPDGRPPEWAKDRWVQVFGYALHDLPKPEGLYEGGVTPFGGNFWIRDRIVKSGYRYNTNVGPHPKRRIMGSETTFLMRLQQEDYRMVWCPDVVVEHRVCRQELVPEKIIRRGFSFGRGKIYCSGIARSKLFTASPRLWFVCEVILLVGAMFRYLLNYLRVNSARRIHGTIGASRAIGFHLESLKRKGIPSAWGKEAKG